MARVRGFVLLMVAALVLRVLAAAAFGIDGAPVEDERGYVALAHSVADGRGFELAPPDGLRSADGSTVAVRTAFRAPLLPLVLAPFAAVDASTATLRIVCIVFGALGAPLLWLAARRELSPRIAVAVALAYAAWPPSVYLSLRVLSEPLGQACLLAGVAVLTVTREARGGRAAPWWAGALAGLAVLARPAALPVAALLAFAAGSKRRAAVFGVAFVLVLAPWIVRNAVLHGRPLITSNSGVTLIGGNSQAALDAPHPGKWVAPELVYASDSTPPDLGLWGWSGLSEEASDRRFRDDAAEWVRAHPASAVRLVVWKVVRLLDPDPHSAKGDAAWKSRLGWLTFAPVLLLALVGLVSRRRETRLGSPWPILILGTILVVCLFYGDSRMRSAADPALLVFAGHGLSARRRPTRGARAAADPGTK